MKDFLDNNGIKAVLFDMDGLMFDTERLYMETWYPSAKKFGYEVHEPLLISLLGKTAELGKQICEEHFGIGFPFYEIRKERLALSNAIIKENGIKLKPGLIELLDYLDSKGIKKAVATSSEKFTADFYLEVSGLTDRFDAVISGDNVTKSKPDPEIFLIAAQKVGVAPKDCMVLEDSFSGIEAAYKGGMHPVMVPDILRPAPHIEDMCEAIFPTLWPKKSSNASSVDTITLNPTFDRHLYMDTFLPEEQNRALKEVVCAGGKGINVSRVLGVLGTVNTAVAAVGEYGIDEYLKLVGKDEINLLPFYVRDQRVRSNVVIHAKNAPETGISTDTFSLTPFDLERIYTLVVDEWAAYTVFSGRIPQGLTSETVIDFLKKIKDTNTKLAVDSSSLSITDLIEIKPWLIKPNRSEVRALGFDVTDWTSAKKAAEELCAKGISNVIVSLDGEGGVYVGEKGAYKIEVPTITNPISTVGAGDSTVAGFITAIGNDESIENALRLAFACGTAACMTEATLPPRKDHIDAIAKEIIITAI